VGASDNVTRGESTFMVEMKETARILKSATSRSFVVLDEIGRGTSTYDGLAIAWSVAEYMHDSLKCRALFATHYHELTHVANRSPRAANVSVTAREHRGDIVFLHRVEQGAASRSYGVACAKLAGLPENVLARARAVLEMLESTGGASLFGAGSTAQLPLFAAKAHPQPVPQAGGGAASLEEKLRALDLDALTPRAALDLLYELQTRARSG
jgi:DNA mismatch repair protein MutS